MLAVDVSGLPAGSTVALVARSSAAPPDFVLADQPTPRVVAARWRRRDMRLDGPIVLEQHLLSYCERGGAVSTVVADGMVLRARQHTGSVSFLPAGRYERCLLDTPGEVVHLHLYIAAEALEEATARSGGHRAPRLRPLLGVREPWFDAFFRLLSAEYEACRAADRLEAFDLVDRLGDLLMQRILGLMQRIVGPKRASHDAAPDSALHRASPLRPFLLRTVLAHVDGHLADRLRLDELAAIASMSVDHFVRAFEEATGSTPHQWIVERRLDAACRKLRGSVDHIDDIARACGFAGAAHFSATFRRHRGVTPSAYRRSS